MSKFEKKELSLKEKAELLNSELIKAAEVEQKEIVDAISKILNEKGYGLTAKVTLEMGKEMKIEPFIFKFKKE